MFLRCVARREAGGLDAGLGRRDRRIAVGLGLEQRGGELLVARFLGAGAMGRLAHGTGVDLVLDVTHAICNSAATCLTGRQTSKLDDLAITLIGDPHWTRADAAGTLADGLDDGRR